MEGRGGVGRRRREQGEENVTKNNGPIKRQKK